MSDICPHSNQSDTAVASTAASALSDHMRISLNVPTVRKHDTSLVGNLASVLCTYLSSLDYEPCQRTPHMRKRCAIKQIMSKRPALSRTFLMEVIIGPYWIPSSLLTRVSLFTFSPTHATSPSVFQQTGLLHSSGVVRRAN